MERTPYQEGWRHAPQRALPERVQWVPGAEWVPLAVQAEEVMAALTFITVLLARTPETLLRMTSTRSPCKEEGRCTQACVSCWGNGFWRCHEAPEGHPGFIFSAYILNSLWNVKQDWSAAGHLSPGNHRKPFPLLWRLPGVSPCLHPCSPTTSSSGDPQSVGPHTGLSRHPCSWAPSFTIVFLKFAVTIIKQ